MFPEKIRRFVSQLISHTDAGKVPWEYDRFDAVFYQEKDFSVELHYSFEPREACGVFRLVYKTSDDQRHEFFTNSDCEDYPLAKQLYDCALASGIVLPF